MLNRSSFLALAAITTLSVAALAPTSASAFGGHGGFARGHVGIGHVGISHVGISRAHVNFGIRTNRVVSQNYHWNWRWRNHRYFGYPVAVGATVATGAVYAATPRAPATTCNCLTKEYLPDGSLLFKDVCTNEAAMAAVNQQAEAPMPQAK